MIAMFGFPSDTNCDDPALSTNGRFVTKGIRLIRAIDMAVSFLGPDMELLEDELSKLGWRHLVMQAQPEHWPVIGEALFCVFEDFVIGGFTNEVKEAWALIYNFMGFHMIQGLKADQTEPVNTKYISLHGNKPSFQELTIHLPLLSDHEKVGNNHKKQARLVDLPRQTAYRHLLQCDKKVPISSISYACVHNVASSWQIILNIPEWEKVTGELFIRYIFKLKPKTVEMFGFPSNTDYCDPDLVQDIKFMTKGIVLIKAIDTSVHLLGPDLYPLEDTVLDLGKRHVQMQAQPEHWPRSTIFSL